MTAGARTWPLVGRGAELARIARAREDGLAGIVIHGPSGLGKSRLAREALSMAAQEGAVTAWVQATRSAATVPLGAFASLIPADVRSDDLLQLMQRSVRALQERADGQPLVIALDDAQWLDPTSAALALHLANTASAFLVVTVRSGERSPDAIVALWKDAGASRFELGVLTAEDSERLVEAIVGGPVERSARHAILETSGGNALYLRELVIGAAESGALQASDGLWRLRGALPVSDSLNDLVTTRMQDLDGAERHALELLALGEPLRLSEILKLAGGSALTVLEERGLLDAAGPSADAEVRLAHPLYGEAVRSSLGSLRGRELRLTLVRIVESRSELDPEDTVRLARWLSDAGEPVAPGLLIRAARAANEAGDPAFGATLAEQALDAGAGVEASLLLARSLAVRNRFEDAELVLAAAEGTIQTQADALAYLQQQSDVLHWGLGQSDQLRALLDRAADWWPEPAWRDQVQTVRLLVTHFEEFRGGRSDIAAATGPADPDAEIRTVADLFYGGQTRAARERVERIRPAVPVRTVTDAIALLLWNRITLEDGERWPELEAWMATTLDTAVPLGDHATAGHAAYSLGCLRTQEGRYADAAAILAEAEAQLERHDPLSLLCVINAQQAIVAGARVDPEEASAALERCRQRLGESGPLAHQLPYVVRAEAWTMHARGEYQHAQGRLLDAAEELKASPVHAAGLTYDALRAGADPRSLADALATVGERCDARLVAAYVAHARARAGRDGVALLSAAEEFASIGALRYASEAAAHAAEAFVHAGRQDSARRAAARSRELFVPDQGAARPVIHGLDQAATDLTRRESELVALASQGLTNAQIAERLVLSIRTVESHLYRAMTKLGVSDRRDL